MEKKVQANEQDVRSPWWKCWVYLACTVTVFCLLVLFVVVVRKTGNDCGAGAVDYGTLSPEDIGFLKSNTEAATDAPVITTEAPTDAPVITTEAPTTAPITCTRQDDPMSIKILPGSDMSWFPSQHGANDKRGALNFITDEKRMEAFGLVKTGEKYEMAVVSAPDTPTVPGRYFNVNVQRVDMSDTHNTTVDHTNTEYMEDQVNSSIGVGTHIDGLGHIGIADRYYNGVKSGDLAASDSDGIKGELSCDNIKSITTRAVVLDMAAYKNLDYLEMGYVITPDDIVGAAREKNVCIGEGDVLLLWTGWLTAGTGEYADGGPGIGVEAAQYIANLGVVVIGTDTIYAEVKPPEEGAGLLQPHQILIPQNGVYIMEVVDSKAFLDAGHNEGLIVIAVPRLSGSVQTNVNPVIFV